MEEIILEMLLSEVLSADSNAYRLIQLGVLAFFVREFRLLRETVTDIKKTLASHIKDDDEFKETVENIFRKNV